jgi:hypothetical protein
MEKKRIEILIGNSTKICFDSNTIFIGNPKEICTKNYLGNEDNIYVEFNYYTQNIPSNDVINNLKKFGSDLGFANFLNTRNYFFFLIPKDKYNFIISNE